MAMPFLRASGAVRAQRGPLSGLISCWLLVTALWAMAALPPGACAQERPSPFDVDVCLDDLQSASASAQGPRGASARTEYLAALYSLGRAEEAVRGWREWVAADPTVLTAVDRLFWFCLALMDTERTGEAAALLEQARVAGLLDRERSYWTGVAKELLCAAYVELAEFDHARDLALEIIRHGIVQEARILALYDLARAHEALGEGEEAKAVWELLAATGGDSPEATLAAERLRHLPSSRGAVPATAACAHRRGRRCFHLGSWFSRSAAVTQAATAAAAGVEAVIREDVSPRGTLFTLVAGAFSTDEEAAAARLRLFARGITGIIEIDCAASSEASP